MSVLICGSRNPRNPFACNITVSEMVVKLNPGMVILNGGALGVDSYVIDAVRQNPLNVVVDLGTDWSAPWRPVTDALTCLVFRPDWTRHGKKAGILRNLHMLDLRPEMVVALWNGQSPGTKQVIGEARRRGIETVVIDA